MQDKTGFEKAAAAGNGNRVPTTQAPRPWTAVAGAWLGIGTSPGTLLVGAGIAARHAGPVPALSIILGVGLVAIILWLQGSLGLLPPIGHGETLTGVAPRYFDRWMQRALGALIALGMAGWLGFNLGLGAAGLAALLGLPQWGAVLLFGIPIWVLAFGGLRNWNWLAVLTTVSVMILVVALVRRFAPGAALITARVDDLFAVAGDATALVGYIAVFGVRAPDFTAGLAGRRDLATVLLLLCAPLLLTGLAGLALEQGTGSTDVVTVLATSGQFAAGNLLVALAVVAPAFTCLFSGVPALQAATGLRRGPAMVAIGAVGLALAATRFDLRLLPWLAILGAVLPPLIVPLAAEAHARRRGRTPRLLPPWLWLPGSAAATALTLAHHPLALLVGLALPVVITAAWYASRPPPLRGTYP